MVEEGKYTQHWLKYAAVIHVLLRNTDTKNQKLQFYKHEFEHGKNKNHINVSFSFNIVKGRAVNVLSTTTIVRDLMQVLDTKSATRLMLKERRIKVSLGKSYELLLEKIEDNSVIEIDEAVPEINQIDPVVEVN